MKLSACPFCGSETINDTTDPDPDEHGYYFWVCPECVCCGPIGKGLQEATVLWNQRAKIDNERK